MAPGKVLLVDDDKFMRMLATAALKPLGCEILEAIDGESAVAAAREHRPDVIILDVVMPRMDGFAVLDALRHDEATRDIAILMVTTAGTSADVKHGADEGADGYIVKPFNHAELRAKVSQLLEG